jgi:hypothetical protein
VEDDDAYERSQEKSVKLYHVSDASGMLEVILEAISILCFFSSFFSLELLFVF